MTSTQHLFDQIQHHFSETLLENSALGKALWDELLLTHPADIAEFFMQISNEQAVKIFKKFSHKMQLQVFEHLSDIKKTTVLSALDTSHKTYLLSNIPADQLTDLFEHFSDKELHHYLNLLHKKDQEQIVSMLKFNPESAGGIMDTDVITLLENFTVAKAIQILQRLQPKHELHRNLYVTDQDNHLVGHINLEDLVIKHPQNSIGSFLRKNELVAFVEEDQEEIAKKMIHYHLDSVPVVDKNNSFLGVIPSEILPNIIEQEASEDVYKMAAMAPIKQTYFETSFFKVLYERSSILIILLMAQTLSTLIVKRYELILQGFLMYFLTMLTSTGGNTSSQSSAVVIQGMASGDIAPGTIGRFLRREFTMAALLSFILGFFSFIRVYVIYGRWWESLAVSVSLGLIVLVSVALGSVLPILLKKLRIDPAFSAGPGLATIMDILGLLIYCYISSLILG